MNPTRTNVEFAKRIGNDRVGNDYVYGGNWDPFNTGVGTDCSGCVIDICDAVRNGTRMAWSRHGMSTETWRPVEVGQTGTIFNAVCVASPADFPADAAVKIALHHGPGGGENSHMWCEVDGVRFESNGTDGCVTGAHARSVYDTSYANDWHYIPGPIDEDGAPHTDTPAPVQNTFFADVSEFQVPVDDSYPYPVLSIRVSDGTYQDHKFAQNYAWMRAALDSGRLAFGIVYTYVRTNWQANADTVRAMIDANSGLHPQVALMLDVESGGNPSGDGSDWINHLYWNLADYAGSPGRIIGYANAGDFNSMWQQRPDGLRVIGAGYGSDPNLPGQVAHQYTDGAVGGNQGLPMGCNPFGNCDMNVADNLSPQDFAAACGIGINTWDTVLNEIMGV